MNSGKYVFAQLIVFLPQKAFQRIVMRYQGDNQSLTISDLVRLQLRAATFPWPT